MKYTGADSNFSVHCDYNRWLVSSPFSCRDDSRRVSFSNYYSYQINLNHNHNNRFPESTLINGRGRYQNGPTVPLTAISVAAGKRYRLRFINIACFPYYNVSIDNHQLTIIESDGVEISPIVVDSFQIHAGQRYSAIVCSSSLSESPHY